MSETQLNEVSRRDFLRLGVTVTAGLVVPPLVFELRRGGDGSTPSGPRRHSSQPLDIQSVNGLLDVTIILSYLTIPFQGTIVTLRNMFGTIPAPTLRLNVGDKLRIKIINKLPPNPPDPEPTKHLRYHNSTNLHTHGLHVYPDIYPQPAVPPYKSPNTTTPPLLYGDFVVDDPEQGIKPGEERQYEYFIREDHPAGTFWYHPHLHGSSAMQVGSGMAGTLIIEGPIDEVPEIAAAAEKNLRVPGADLRSGDREARGLRPGRKHHRQRADLRHQRRAQAAHPHEKRRSAELAVPQRRRSSRSLNLSLDSHTLFQYSHDGNPRRTLKPCRRPVLDPRSIADLRAPPPTPPEVVLAAANRTDVLVKAGAPGTYQLRRCRSRWAQSSRTETTQ